MVWLNTDPRTRTRRIVLILSFLVLISGGPVQNEIRDSFNVSRDSFSALAGLAHLCIVILAAVFILYILVKEWRENSNPTAHYDGIIHINKNKQAAAQIFLRPEEIIVVRILDFYQEATGISDFCESDLGCSSTEAKSTLFNLARDRIRRDKRKSKRAVAIIKSALYLLAYCLSDATYASINAQFKLLTDDSKDESVRREALAAWTHQIQQSSEEADSRAEQWANELNDFIKENRA